MRYGLALPQFGRHAKPATITSFVRCAEDLGYRSFWVGDRVLTPVDPLTCTPSEARRSTPTPRSSRLSSTPSSRLPPQPPSPATRDWASASSMSPGTTRCCSSAASPRWITSPEAGSTVDLAPAGCATNTPQ